MTSSAPTGGDLGFESALWRAADALRGQVDAAEYKHVVLGLLFLKYISDAFEEQHAKLDAEKSQGAEPEDPDEYRAQNIFWVPPEALERALAGHRRAGLFSAFPFGSDYTAEELVLAQALKRLRERMETPVSYTHLTLPTTPYV